tara:strand:+ start:2158 stop:3294 length:1137 start_codon:yes stop_codon:yes gene_type:complete
MKGIMNLIKSAIVVIFSSLLAIKSIDAFWGYLSGNLVLSDISLSNQRSIQLREYDPNQIVSVLAGSEYFKRPSLFEPQKIKLNIDQNGFISTGNEITYPADSDVLSILFTGGSTTETLYIQELSRFPSVVERRLADKLVSKVRVINAGVSGNHSIHSLINLIGKGIELDLDYAVWMHNINDMAVLTKTGSYWLAPLSRSIVQSKNFDRKLSLMTTFRVLKNFFMPNLYVYLKPRLFPSVGPLADEFERVGSPWNQINKGELAQQFKSSTTSFVVLCRTWGIEPILMTQFNRIDRNDSAFQFWYENIKDRGLSQTEFIELYDQFNEIIRQVAVENNVFLIDLAVLVPSTSRYIYDVVHLNEEGSLLVGDLFAKEFLKQF